MQRYTQKTTTWRCLALAGLIAVAGAGAVRSTPVWAADRPEEPQGGNGQDHPEDTQELGRVDFRLHNHAGKTIMYVYVRKHGDTSWGEDLLGSDTVEDGADYTVHPEAEADAGNMFDIRIRMDGNKTHFWSNLDLSEISDVTMTYDAQNKAHITTQ